MAKGGREEAGAQGGHDGANLDGSEIVTVWLCECVDDSSH